mmetsp:Transcript_33906/g.74674  ORF Transcript_33906/g.74674 Transcript_33906/m.74674 type:complete len:236 (-) Transcript_33906:173-880(-)
MGEVGENINRIPVSPLLLENLWAVWGEWESPGNGSLSRCVHELHGRGVWQHADLVVYRKEVVDRREEHQQQHQAADSDADDGAGVQHPVVVQRVQRVVHLYSAVADCSHVHRHQLGGPCGAGGAYKAGGEGARGNSGVQHGDQGGIQLRGVGVRCTAQRDLHLRLSDDGPGGGQAAQGLVLVILVKAAVLGDGGLSGVGDGVQRNAHGFSSGGAYGRLSRRVSQSLLGDSAQGKV